MSKKNIFLAITQGLWLIDAQSAQNLGENVASVLKGEKFWNQDHKSDAEFTIVSNEKADTYITSDASSVKNKAVAVIDISGPIIKYDNCGDPGSKTLGNIIKNLNANPNISGIVLCIDSPGGSVAGTEELASIIESVSKPVVTLAQDLMCSAAYWIGSKANFIFANNETTRIGSIGTMLSFADMQPMWEKQGVVFHEIYASASTEKNKEFADARKKNYDGIIKSTLDPLNNVFLSSVKASRGEKLKQESTLNGQVYVAAEALKHGLIDAIGNLDDAIAKVNELADQASVNQNSNTQSQNQDMKKITLLASHAALLAICGATIAAGETSVEVELSSENLDKINSLLASASTHEANATQAAADLVAEKAAAKLVSDELDALKQSNPGASGSQRNGTDVIESADDTEFLTSVDKEKAELKAKGLL